MEMMENKNSPPLYNPQAYRPPTQQTKMPREFLNMSPLETESTVVTVIPEEVPVRDHLVWSIFNTVYMNFCCLGVSALLFSVKSRDRKVLKDENGAVGYGITARNLNIAATTLSILFLVIMIAILIASAKSSMPDSYINEYINEYRNEYKYGK